MKYFLVLYCLLCSALPITAQNDYAYADNKALKIPKDSTYTTSGIAHYINQYFKNDKEKIRAVYTWVISNVAYSKDSMYYFNTWGNDPEERMSAILRRRKGVCENYAALFANIVSKCGVQAVVVSGYTKTGSSVNWTGHGWAAVYAEKEWLLCDPTWDAGYYSYRFFLVRPDEFINTHMPFDPIWQLLEHPVTHQEFAAGFMHSKKAEPVFYFNDSVAAYLQADTLQQMQAASRRMNAAGIENEDLRTWYAYNQMKIHIVQQEENMQLFNDAVLELNNAKKLYNEFVQYRNNHFMPVKTDDDIKKMFAAIEKLMAASYKKMERVGGKSENYQYDTDGLKENLDALTEKVKTQQLFLQKYFSSNEAENLRLF